VAGERNSFQWHVDGLGPAEVAQRMGIAPSAVRYYADQGLLPHRRTSGNQRRFHADVLCRVAMIHSAQRVGLSLHEIREALAELPPGQVPSRADWDKLADRLRTVLTARIDTMFDLLDELGRDLDAPGLTASPREV
jgi:MerR family transcriptional regulator, redox-sensitive transcriptional activator SoxR